MVNFGNRLSSKRLHKGIGKRNVQTKGKEGSREWNGMNGMEWNGRESKKIKGKGRRQEGAGKKFSSMLAIPSDIS